MRIAYLAILLVSATAAGAQSQTAPQQTSGSAQSQSTSCGLACSVSDTPAAPAAGGAGNTKLPPNLAKLAENKSGLDKVVCEAQETLGTRLGAKKVCMTVAQWLVFQNDVKDQTRRIEILGHVSH